VHSALIALRNSSLPADAFRAMATIVAADQFTDANKYTVTLKGEIGRPDDKMYFVRVAPGTDALKLQLDAPKGKVSMTVTGPDTRGVGGGLTPKASNSVIIPHPEPGTYEIDVINTNVVREFDPLLADSVLTPTSVTLMATAIGVSASGGNENGGQFEMTNRLGVFTGGVTSSALGAAMETTKRITTGERHMYEIDVPAGSTLLTAQVRVPQGSDIDVYAFDCSTKDCRAAASGANVSGSELIAVENPAAGKWRIVVDAFNTPADGASYDYMDVVFNPTFGAVSVTDVSSERALGAKWTAKANVWRNDLLPGGRRAFPALVLKSALGSLPVILKIQELR
jgi:hypothetical protein